MNDLPPVEIRDARIEDVPAIAAIHVAGFEEAHRGIVDDRIIEERTIELRTRVWRARLSDPPARSFVLVAEVDGKAAGFFSGRPAREREDDGRGWGCWENLYIASTYKPRARVATPLARAAFRRFGELGFEDAVAFHLEGNTRSRELLLGLGLYHDGHFLEVGGSRSLRMLGAVDPRPPRRVP